MARNKKTVEETTEDGALPPLRAVTRIKVLGEYVPAGTKFIAPNKEVYEAALEKGAAVELGDDDEEVVDLTEGDESGDGGDGLDS